MDNSESPLAKVEYIFVEKAEKQEKTINDEQGYLMGFINLFSKDDNFTAFKMLVHNELNFSIKNQDYFKNKEVDLNDYKFALVDNDRKFLTFEQIDEPFYKALKDSLRNLLIVGKIFNIEEFKHLEIFDDWYENYSNRS
jgi:hypothetical protein